MILIKDNLILDKYSSYRVSITYFYNHQRVKSVTATRGHRSATGICTCFSSRISIPKDKVDPKRYNRLDNRWCAR